jgi:hypothetical protein
MIMRYGVDKNPNNGQDSRLFVLLLLSHFVPTLYNLYYNNNNNIYLTMVSTLVGVSPYHVDFLSVIVDCVYYYYYFVNDVYCPVFIFATGA